MIESLIVWIIIFLCGYVVVKKIFVKIRRLKNSANQSVCDQDCHACRAGKEKSIQ